MTEHTLQTQNLSVGYDETTIIEDLNLEIPAHKVSVIIGANGCGKSTLMKTLSRLLKPEKGQVVLDGKAVHGYPSTQLAPTTYLDIAYQVEILDLLTELNRRKGTTIVMILHDVNLSARYANHLFALCRGKLIAEGKPADVITEELMQKVYQLNCIVMKDPLSGAPLIVPKGKY